MINNIVGARNELEAGNVIQVAVSDHKTGAEVWRGDFSAHAYTRYMDTCNDDSGACEAYAFLRGDDMREIGVEPNQVVFCEEM